MQRVGDELLAGAVLPLDEHVGVARRHRVHEFEQLAHHLALPDDRAHAVRVAQLRAQFLVRDPLVHLARRAFEDADDAGRIELALLHEEEGTGLAGVEGAGDGALAADDDDLGARRAFLHQLQHVHAVAVGQQQVEQHDVGPPFVEHGQPGPAEAGRTDVERRIDRRLFDDHLEPVDRGRVVIDDQHTPAAGLDTGHGCSSIIPDPRARAAPRTSAIIRAMADPRPLPPITPILSALKTGSRACRRQPHGVRTLRRRDVPHARGVAARLPLQDRLLRLVGRPPHPPGAGAPWTSSSPTSAPRVRSSGPTATAWPRSWPSTASASRS
jgi:hypothetical protein